MSASKYGTNSGVELPPAGHPLLQPFLPVNTGVSRRTMSSGIIRAPEQTGDRTVKLVSPGEAERIQQARQAFGNNFLGEDTPLVTSLPSLHGSKPGILQAIRPESRFRVTWDLIVMTFVVVNVILIPFNVAFRRTVKLDSMFYLDLVMDCFFVADLILNFFTGFWDADGRLVLDLARIRAKYVKGFFMIDLLSVAPVDYIILAIHGPKSQYFAASRFPRIFRLLRLVRLLRLQRLLRYFARFESRLNIPWVKLRLIKALVLLALMLHWHCCLHYLAASLTDFDPKSWVVRAGVVDSSTYTKYMFALFDVTSLLVASGWGLYPSGGPILMSEQWLIIYFMFASAIVWAAVTGMFSAMMLNEGSSRSTYFRKLDEVLHYMEYRKLDAATRIRIRQHFRLKYRHNVYDQDDVLKDLPRPLLRDIALYKLRAVIEAVPLLNDTGQGFLNAIAPELEHVPMPPNELVIAEGEPPSDLYFIASGSVTLFYNNQPKNTCHAGGFFGEVALLWDILQPVSVVTLTDCELYAIPQDAFNRIVKRYPDVVTMLRYVSSQRLADWNASIKLDPNSKLQVIRDTSSLVRVQQHHADNRHTPSKGLFTDIFRRPETSPQ